MERADSVRNLCGDGRQSCSGRVEGAKAAWVNELTSVTGTPQSWASKDEGACLGVLM